jgi:PAS domain S-box-containing protein
MAYPGAPRADEVIDRAVDGPPPPCPEKARGSAAEGAATATRRLSSAQRLAAVLGPPVVVLLVGLLAYGAVRHTVEGMDRLTRAHRVSALLERVLARSVDAETAVRGFLLTGDERFLQPFEGVREDVAEAMDSLRALVLEPAQQERLAALGPLVETRLALVERRIALGRTGDPAAVRAAVRSGEGQRAMDAIRGAVREIQQAQGVVIAVRQGELHRRAGWLIVVVLGGTAAVFGLAFLTNLLLARHARSQEELARDLEERNALLEEQGLELEMQAEELGAQAVQLEETATELEVSNDELQRAQEATLAAEAEKSALLESAGDGIFGVDLEGRCTFISRRAAELLGYTVGECLGRNMHALIHHHGADGAEYPEDTCPIFLAGRGGNGARVAGEVLWRKDGAPLPVEYSSFPLVQGGTIRGTVVTFADITERRRAEDRVQVFAQVLEESRNEIYLFDARTLRFTQVNRGARENLGYSMEELAEMTPLDLKPEVTPEQFERLVAPLRHGTEDVSRFRTVHRRKDGSLYPVDVHLQLSAARERPLFVAFVADVTERERLTREIERQHALLRTMTQNATSALLMMDAQGRGTFWNPAAERMTGYSAEEAIGRTLHELVHHTYPDGTPFPIEECPIDRALPSGVEVKGYEDVFIRKDGTFFPVVCAAQPILEDGEPVGTVIEVRDATEEKQAEEALWRAKEAAEEANLAKMQFLSTMSHELRTPLNAIGGYVDLMELAIHGPVTEAQRKSLERIKVNQQHLLSLINDVLHYAKIEAGSVEYEIEDLPVNELLGELEPLIEPQVRTARLEYRCAPGDPSLTARGDWERIRQILLNLITNALKFTPSGGQIAVSCEGDPRWVRIRISDTGRGIPAAMVQKIFDPFFQLRNEQSRDSSRLGVGLGLAISRDLARGMGGELSVESTPGRGSTFTLSLPTGGRGEDDPGRLAGEDRGTPEERRVPGPVAESSLPG